MNSFIHEMKKGKPSVKSMVEPDVLERVIDLIKDGTGWNPYFAYRNLPKDLKEKCSLYEMVVLFYKLEWNCRIINIEEVYKTEAYALDGKTNHREESYPL